MFQNGKNYLNIGRLGNSHPATWMLGFWLTALAFIIGNNLAFGPIVMDPDVTGAMHEHLKSQTDTADIGKQFLPILLMAFSGLSAIPCLIEYKNKERFSPWGALSVIFILLTIVGFYLMGQQSNAEQLEVTYSAALNEVGKHSYYYALMLLGFLPPLIAILVINRRIHNRTARSLITASAKIRWKRMAFAAFITTLILAAATFMLHVSGLQLVDFRLDDIDRTKFILYAIISLSLLPFQSAAEEVIVRGYFNQALARFMENKSLVFILTSFFFMLMHSSNPEAAAGYESGWFDYLMTMGSYFAFGLMLCIIVYFEGGLEAAIGVHAANNIFAAVFVNYEQSVLPTPSVFLAPIQEGGSIIGLLVILGIIACVLLATRQKTQDFNTAAMTLEPDVRHL